MKNIIKIFLKKLAIVKLIQKHSCQHKNMSFEVVREVPIILHGICNKCGYVEDDQDIAFDKFQNCID